MTDSLTAAAREALRDVIDPEVGIDVVELGLVYGIEERNGRLKVSLTMTTPACPLGEQIVAEAEARLRRVPGATDAQVTLVWEPPWDPSRMSAKAKEQLGW
jgi:metal-sulfur cluster biosynthetic enzyme